MLKPEQIAILDKHRGNGATSLISLSNDLGLKVFRTNDFTDAESGLITKEDGSYNIYLNEKHPATRQRFTLAHEIAHFLLHKDKLDANQEFVDTVRQPSYVMHRTEKLNGLTNEEKKMETEANQLAADILMPEMEFKKIWGESQTIEDVAEKFNVSASAVAFRATNLLGETMM